MVASADAVSGDWRPGEKRDVFRDTARIASGVVAKSLFGADVQGMAEHLGEAVAVFMDGLRIRGESLISFPLWVPTPTNRRLRRAIAILDRVIYGFITERRAAPSSTETSARPDLLSLLLAARDDDGSGMTDAQLRDEVMTIFVAGFETTSVAMAAALFYLAAHPEVQARVRQEIRAVLGTRAPTVVDLPALGLIERVAKEALRLFPPAFCFDRDVIEPVELGGHTLEPGTLVLMAPYFTQRDPRYWKSPEAFDPDRWLDPATKALPKGIYLPFGLGPRICIGAAFAMQELVLVLARLCQRFAFVEVPGAPLVGDPGFTLRPKGGVMLEIRAEGP